MTLLKQSEPVYSTHPDTGYNKLPPVYQVDPNEKIFGLWELNLTAPDSKSVRRYEIIIVKYRDGKGQYVADMGLASLWGVDQICVPGSCPCGDCKEGIITLAKARGVADEIREKNMQHILSLEPEDLHKGFYDMVEEAISIGRQK